MVRTPVDSFSSSSITRVMDTDWAAMDVVVLFMIILILPIDRLMLECDSDIVVGRRNSLIQRLPVVRVALSTLHCLLADID